MEFCRAFARGVGAGIQCTIRCVEMLRTKDDDSVIGMEQDTHLRIGWVVKRTGVLGRTFTGLASTMVRRLVA